MKEELELDKATLLQDDEDSKKAEFLLEEYFRTFGTSFELGKNKKLFLHEMPEFLYLADGEIEIFADIKGTMTFLLTTRSKKLLLPFLSQEKYQIIAVATTTCKFISLENSYFFSSALNEMSDSLNFHASEWIGRLSNLFKNHRDNTIVPQLVNGKDQEWEKGAVFSSAIRTRKSNIQWIDLRKGVIGSWKESGFEIGSDKEIFPLPYHFFFEVKENAIFNILNSEEAIQQNGFWMGISLFHDFLLSYLANQNQTRRLEQQTSNKAAQDADKELLSRTLSHLTAVAEDGGGIPIYSGKSALMQALQILGSLEGLPFSFRQMELQESSSEDAIEAVCCQSAVKKRKVSLKEGWWKKDYGSLLAFAGPQNSPIVLRKKGGGRYRYIDAATKKSLPLSEDIKKALHHEAYTFHPLFDEKEKLEIQSLVAFGLKGRGKDFFLLFIWGLCGILFSLVLPFSSRIVVNYAIPHYDKSILLQLILGLFSLGAASAFFTILKNRMIVRINGLIGYSLQSAFFDRVLHFPADFFKTFQTGDLVRRLFLINLFKEKFLANVFEAALNLLFALVYLLVLFNLSVPLAWIGSSVAAIGLIFTVWKVKAQLSLGRMISSLQANLRGKLPRFLNGLSQIKLSCAENRVFADIFRDYLKKKEYDYEIDQIFDLTYLVKSTLPFLAFFLFTLFLVYDLENMKALQDNHIFLSKGESINPGSFLAFLIIYYYFYSAMSNVTDTLVEGVNFVPIWESSKKLFLKPSEARSQLPTPELKGGISFFQVFFKYERSQKRVLNNLSLTIAPGEFIAICGAIGSGKSTLIRLLLGFEKLEKGAITFDGRSIHECNIQGIRKQIGVVLQDASIFDGTIRENVSGGRRFSDEEVFKALEKVDFIRDLAKLPRGLDTIITGEATRLSRGQCQKITLARAIIGNPKILLLDEATNFLDNQAQKIIWKNIREMQCTRIAISHQWDSIEQADRIYLFENQQVLQAGTFDELYKKREKFSHVITMHKSGVHS